MNEGTISEEAKEPTVGYHIVCRFPSIYAHINRVSACEPPGPAAACSYLLGHDRMMKRKVNFFTLVNLTKQKTTYPRPKKKVLDVIWPLFVELCRQRHASRV
jgi:hypothetical protein